MSAVIDVCNIKSYGGGRGSKYFREDLRYELNSEAGYDRFSCAYKHYVYGDGGERVKCSQ